MTDDEHSIDLVRDALQVHVNERGDAEGNGGWLVAHYVIVAGLYRVNEDGVPQTHSIVTRPMGQADYITDGLMASAPGALASCEDCEADDDALDN